MEKNQELFDRIRAYLYLNNAHLIDWFEDFDKLRSGRITKDQFRRCFEFIKFSLKETELNYIFQQFGENGQINYRKFWGNVSTVFTNPDLELNPTAPVEEGRKIVDKVTNKITSSMPQELDSVFSKMRLHVHNFGTHIRDAYADFDTHNSGRVTKSQFLRNFPFHNLSVEEQNYILQRYLDPSIGDVNYKRFHQDLIDYIGIKEFEEVKPDLSLPHHKQSITLHPLPSNPANVIERFATYVRKNRVRVYDFFISHDPLKSGRVAPETFMNVLTLFGFTFSQEELIDLSERYKIRIEFSDFVKYREFCSDVTKVEENPQTVITQPKASQQQNIKPKQILSKIQSFIITNRINIIPPFQDFDRNKRGYVTNIQFHRVLSVMTVPISKDEISVLAEFYSTDNGVDYFQFVEDVDPAHAQQRRDFKPIGSNKDSIESIYGRTPSGDAFITSEEADQMIHASKKGLLPKLNEPLSIQQLIESLQKWGYIHSVHFHDFLKDFDKFNSGDITNAQLRSGLLIAGYRLTDNEFDLLCNNYSSSTKTGYIKWRQFSDDVLSFVAPKILETNPRTNPISPNSSIFERSLTTEIPPKIKSIIERIHHYIVQRRISLTEQFIDKDKHKHKQVSIPSFAQSMQLIGVHVSKQEIDLLCQYYLDKSTNFVLYPAFIADVESLGPVFIEKTQNREIEPLSVYATQASSFVPKKPILSSDQIKWTTLLKKIQDYVYQRRIRVYEFFENFDRLRHGSVTKQKFRTVIGEIDIPLSEDEIQFVIRMFSFEKQPDLFNYREFCDQVDTVFGKKNLHRDPHASASCIASNFSKETESLSQIENEEIIKVLSRMRNRVTTRRMEILHQFEDYDKSPHRNFITKAQFRQCIGRLGLSSDEKELNLLCKKYKCTDLDEMDYQAFCNDVGGFVEYSNQLIE